MESVHSLKMLGVLALVLLVSSMNEGRIMSKCELKAQLDAAFQENMTGNMSQDPPANMTGNMTQDPPANMTGNMTQNPPGIMTENLSQSVTRNMTGNMTGDLITRLACVVERTSRFNTSLISTIQLPPQPQNTPKPDGPHQKPGEKHDDSSEERPGGKPGDSNGERPGGKPGDSNGGRPGGKPGDSKPNSKPRGKRSPPRAPGGGRDKPPTGSSGVSTGTTMNLYGIFQLSDRVACDSGSNQTLNICRMNCTALIDDDIRDDIACLKTLMGYMSNVMDVMFIEECRSIVPSQYFAVCNDFVNVI